MKLKQQREALRELTLSDLRDRLKDAKEELFNLRFQLAIGQLDNHARISRVRREIARIHTIIREKELATGGTADV